MKSKTIIIGLLALLLASCGEDFLNIPSETSLTNEIYFKTEADFKAAINAAYSPLRALYIGQSPVSTGANGLYVLADMHSDNGRYVLNPGFRATLDQENAADFIYEASNTVSTFQYRQNYLIIARANQILFSIDGVAFDEASKSNIKGQSLFLRAFSYFNLVQLFGSVPMHLMPVTTIKETALPLSEPDAIYTQIISDITSAIELLPEKSAQEAGRITKGAAKILLANVYMVQKNYSSAETILKEIVSSGQYALLADYASIFSPSRKNNSESVFEIQYRQGTDGYSSTFCYSFLPYPLSRDTVAVLTGVTNPNTLSGGEGYNTPSPDLIASYEPGDRRFKASVAYTTITTGGRFPYCNKFLHTHQQLNQADDNFPVYRFAEVLLFLAEAINEQNRPAEALTYINNVQGASPASIRGRAGLSPITAASQSAVRDAIDHERRIELAFENKRWFDLVRTGKAVEVITAYGARVKANPTAYYFPAGFVPPAQSFSDIKLVWPLPADESLYTPYF
jgi:starch-binding outer membrane protein, SusD/RagB family